MKINQRLFDHYGIDTRKDLKISEVCARPFDTLLIDKTGSCYACECQSWLPQSIGNLQVKDLADIIDSSSHRHLKASIREGNYRYCNEHRCPYIKSKNIHTSDSKHIQHLRLAIDNSCNLRCPSCRNHLIFHRSGAKLRLGIRLADRINKWLREYTEQIMVHIGSDGDPFASHVYRHFMEHTPQKDNIHYSLLTNGLMLGDFHSKVPHVISKTKRLGISIDGASEHTYEKLRVGGKWAKILDALAKAKSLKRDHAFEFHLHMVVQEDNWHEMYAMADLSSRYNVDKLFLNRIEDWNTDVDHSRQTFMTRPGFKEELARAMAIPHVRAWGLS